MASEKDLTHSIAMLRASLAHALTAQRGLEAAFSKPKPQKDHIKLTDKVQSLLKHLDQAMHAASSLVNTLTDQREPPGEHHSVGVAPLKAAWRPSGNFKGSVHCSQDIISSDTISSNRRPSGGNVSKLRQSVNGPQDELRPKSRAKGHSQFSQSIEGPLFSLSPLSSGTQSEDVRSSALQQSSRSFVNEDPHASPSTPSSALTHMDANVTPIRSSQKITEGFVINDLEKQLAEARTLASDRLIEIGLLQKVR